MDTRPQARLRQQQAQQHQDQSQQRPAVAARRAQNRQRESFSLGLTVANPAQPESIVTNKSAAAHLSGVCSTYCFIQVYCSTYCCIAVRLYWVGSWVHGGWWVCGGRRLARSPRWPSIVKNDPPSVCFLFHTRSARTNQLTAPRVPGVLLYVLLHCCYSDVRTAALLFCCM